VTVPVIIGQKTSGVRKRKRLCDFAFSSQNMSLLNIYFFMDYGMGLLFSREQYCHAEVIPAVELFDKIILLLSSNYF